MSDGVAIIPADQKQIIFYGDEITAVLINDHGQAQVYIPIRPICETLGVDWSAQYRRIKRDPVLAQEVIPCVVVTATQGQPEQRREVLCLPLDYINGWLFGIDANRIRAELRDKVITYQRECYRVLANAFQSPSELDTTSTAEQQSLMQIREMGRAIMQMAEQQLALTVRVDKAAMIVGEHGRRITSLEQQLAPRQAISDEQATDIAEKVKALAMALTEQDSSKNQFQSIFGELYRRFRVSSYKVIRQSQYHLVIDFLDEWAETVVKGKGAKES